MAIVPGAQHGHRHDRGHGPPDGSADTIGKAIGALGSVSGRTLGGLPAGVAGATGHQARSDVPSLPDLLGGGLLPQLKPPHVALPGVPTQQ